MERSGRTLEGTTKYANKQNIVLQATNILGKNFERAETGTSRGTGKKLAIKTKLQLNVRKLTFGTEINLQCKYKYYGLPNVTRL